MKDYLRVIISHLELHFSDRGLQILEPGENGKKTISCFFLLIKFLHLSLSSEYIGRYSAILFDTASFSTFIWMASSRLS